MAFVGHQSAAVFELVRNALGPDKGLEQGHGPYGPRAQGKKVRVLYVSRRDASMRRVLSQEDVFLARLRYDFHAKTQS